MRQLISITILLLLLLFAGCGRPEPTEISLASVGDRTISLAAFKRSYTPILLYTDKVDTPELRAEVLNYLLEQKILAQTAEAAELDTLAILETIARTTEKSAITRILYTEWVKDRMLPIPEEEIRQGFERYHDRRLVRHLFTPSKTVADSLKTILNQDPGAFDALAADLFQDSSLAASGGVLGWMRFGDMDPDFETAVYELKPGETSTPVKTRFGYHIIRVDDVMRERMLTESDYALMRERIRRIIRQRQESRLSAEVIETFMADAGIEFEEKMASLVWSRIHQRIHQERESGALEERPGNPELQTLRNELAEFRDEPMVSFGNESWTVGDFLERLPEMNRRLLMSDLKRGTVFLIRDELLLQEGRERKLDQRLDVRQEVADRIDQALATAWLQKRSREITLTDEALRTFYREYSQTLYLSADSIYLQEILVPDSMTIIDIKRRLDGGESFSDLASRFSQRPGVIEGRLGWHHPRNPIQSHYYSLLVKKPIRTVVGPLKVPEGYALIQAISRRRSPLPYTEVEAQVRRDLTHDRLRKLRFYEIQTLSPKYEYEINTDLLNRFDLF